jgi:hypothetical protein
MTDYQTARWQGALVVASLLILPYLGRIHAEAWVVWMVEGSAFLNLWLALRERRAPPMTGGFDATTD